MNIARWLYRRSARSRQRPQRAAWSITVATLPGPGACPVGADELLAAFDTEQTRTVGLHLLADLALGLVAAQPVSPRRICSGS